MSVKLSLGANPSKILPSGSTATIDWASAEVFSIEYNVIYSFVDLSLYFINDVQGNEITLKITNTSSTNTLKISWPLFVTAVPGEIAPGSTKIIKLTKIDNKQIIGTTEVSLVDLISYTTAGTYTLTIPYGITQMRVTTIASTGGGGGGAEGRSGGYLYYTGGAGGGGGAKDNTSFTTLAVTAGRSYTVVVGAGGAGGASGNAGQNGSDGAPTTIKDNVTQQIILSVLGGTGGKGGKNPIDTGNLVGTGGDGGVERGQKGQDGSPASAIGPISASTPLGGTGGRSTLNGSLLYDQDGGEGGQGGGGTHSPGGGATAGKSGVSAKMYISFS